MPKSLPWPKDPALTDLTSPWLCPKHIYWSLYTLDIMFTQSLYVYCFLLLEYSSSRYLNGLLSHLLQAMRLYILWLHVMWGESSRVLHIQLHPRTLSISFLCFIFLPKLIPFYLHTYIHTSIHVYIFFLPPPECMLHEDKNFGLCYNRVRHTVVINMCWMKECHIWGAYVSSTQGCLVGIWVYRHGV